MAQLTVQHAEVGIFTSPEIVLENAQTAARALVSVISLKKKPVILNGEQYLEFEDWQTVGQFYGFTVKTGDAVPVEIDGVKGAKAQADLIDLKTGMYLGGAEAYCMRDEEHWNTRPKYEWQDQGDGKDRKRVKVGDEVVPWFQLASMAQTRAGAKAFRNRLAWVVVLAGYRATPAEEMTGNEVRTDTQDRTEHWCKEHNVKFFKGGKMKNYGHKINETGKWCWEGQSQPNVKQAEKDIAELWEGGEPSPEAPEPPTEAGEVVEGSVIDMDKIAAHMKAAKFTPLSCVSWIKSQAVYQTLNLSGKFEDIVGRMNKEQLDFLFKEIEERRGMV